MFQPRETPKLTHLSSVDANIYICYEGSRLDLDGLDKLKPRFIQAMPEWNGLCWWIDIKYTNGVNLSYYQMATSEADAVQIATVNLSATLDRFKTWVAVYRTLNPGT